MGPVSSPRRSLSHHLGYHVPYVSFPAGRDEMKALAHRLELLQEIDGELDAFFDDVLTGSPFKFVNQQFGDS